MDQAGKIHSTVRVKILARLDEVIVQLEGLEGFFPYCNAYHARIEELKELRDSINHTKIVGEIVDLLLSDGTFYELCPV